MIRGINFSAIGKGERQRTHHTTDRGTFVPLVFAPGEAFQFDWSEDWAYVGGERIKLQVAHIKLSHSRAFLVRPICCKRMRCCLMPTGMPSAFLKACPFAGSTTVRLGRHGSEATPNEDSR